MISLVDPNFQHNVAFFLEKSLELDVKNKIILLDNKYQVNLSNQQIEIVVLYQRYLNHS